MPSLGFKWRGIMTIHKDLQYQNSRCLGVIGKITSGLLLAFALAGCAHSISKDLLKEVDKGIGFDELLKDPERYHGKTVLLGGVIIKTENKKDGTLFEIYQTELDYYGEPINTDVSQGRFLAMYDKFLDSEIYRDGRKVTVAGVVNGVEVKKLGEIDYHYPYLIIKEIHLWNEEQPAEYGPPYNYFWNPWWWNPWYPWYDSYWFYHSHLRRGVEKRGTTIWLQDQRNTIDRTNTRGSQQIQRIDE